MVPINQRTRTKVEFLRTVVYLEREIAPWWDFNSLKGESNKSVKNSIFVLGAGVVVIVWEADKKSAFSPKIRRLLIIIREKVVSDSKAVSRALKQWHTDKRESKPKIWRHWAAKERRFSEL